MKAKLELTFETNSVWHIGVVINDEFLEYMPFENNFNKVSVELDTEKTNTVQLIFMGKNHFRSPNSYMQLTELYYNELLMPTLIQEASFQTDNPDYKVIRSCDYINLNGIWTIKIDNALIKAHLKKLFVADKTSDLYLRENESYINYKKRVLDTKSKSFCGAKWYYSTIWLGSGMTTSCHHPLPHRVSEAEVIENYKALANTPLRKKERSEMQQGIQCGGCDYCWRVESLETDAIPDRVYKSVLYSDDLLDKAFQSDPSEDFDLKYLEISFDRTCNLACSYCNPAFSSTWVKDIKVNGPYQDLKTDAQDHYGHAHDSAGMYDKDENNPYVKAFFDWWDADLHKTLSHLRLTGGEPLMSKHTWKLFDWFLKNKLPDLYFAINSNLISKPEIIGKLIKASENIGNFNVYTSCESVGKRAEYIRDGFDWEIWTTNFDRLANTQNVKLHSMCTIGALSLGGLIDYLDWCVVQKQKYGKDTPTFTLNIQRFPKFQNPLVLPYDLRLSIANNLNEWLDKNKEYLHQMEVEHVIRLVDYLKSESNQLGNEDYINGLRRDFRIYYTQFDQRRNKNFVSTFPELGQWYETLS